MLRKHEESFTVWLPFRAVKGMEHFRVYAEKRPEAQLLAIDWFKQYLTQFRHRLVM